jgi:flagellar motor switch protein FliM
MSPRPTIDLTQKDVDSLLTGAAPASRAKAPAAVEIIPYNFLRPPRVSRDRQTLLDGIYAHFANSLQGLFMSRLRSSVDVAVAGVEQATFGEYLLSLGTPCAAFVFELGDVTASQGVLDCGSEMSFLLVDRMFGGPGEPGSMHRPMTPLERLAVKSVADRALGLFADAWGDHLSIKPNQVGFESTPESLQIVAREDNVLVANLDVKQGSFAGLITVCLPLASLEKLLQEKPARLGRSRGAMPDKKTQQQIEAGLRGVRLPLAVRFPAFTLSTGTLARLATGQIIHTGHMADVAFDVCVGGQSRFSGALGTVRNHVGVRIERAFGGVADGIGVAPKGAIL